MKRNSKCLRFGLDEVRLPGQKCPGLIEALYVWLRYGWKAARVFLGRNARASLKRPKALVNVARRPRDVFPGRNARASLKPAQQAAKAQAELTVFPGRNARASLHMCRKCLVLVEVRYASGRAMALVSPPSWGKVIGAGLEMPQ